MENNSNSSDKLLTHIFYSHAAAENAYNSLLSRGYDKDNISILMSNETRNKYSADSDLPNTAPENKAVEGMGVGSAIGGAIGAFAAAIAAIGTVLTIPGLGLIISGPLAAALTGAGAGGITGGIVGALVGYGMPQERAEEYEEAIKAGGIVLGVRTSSDEEYRILENKWKNYA